jgi:tRNA pseudouridine55 synthase
MFGFLNIDKPSGPTSHDIVARVRRRVGRKIKVGHAGTLDPFATGVLVVCVGPATRLASFVQAAPKRYRAEMVLGATSTTDDRDGRIARTLGAAPPAEQAVRQAIGRFVGKIQQVPPAHSAVHVDGQRAYKLARAGQEVEIPAREVHVHSIDLLAYEFPHLALDVKCGSGTYIRALGRDIGEALGVGGYCWALERTAVGVFTVEEARSTEELDPARDLLGPLLALEDLPKITLSEDDLRRIRMGQRVGLEREVASGQAALLDAAGTLVALGEVLPDGRTLQPAKVFVI